MCQMSFSNVFHFQRNLSCLIIISTRGKNVHDLLIHVLLEIHLQYQKFAFSYRSCAIRNTQLKSHSYFNRCYFLCAHDDFIKWKHSLRYWPFAREFPTQRPVTRSFDVFFDLCINGWVNHRKAGDLRRHRGHYDVTQMICWYRLQYNFITHFSDIMWGPWHLKAATVVCSTTYRHYCPLARWIDQWLVVPLTKMHKPFLCHFWNPFWFALFISQLGALKRNGWLMICWLTKWWIFTSRLPWCASIMRTT